MSTILITGASGGIGSETVTLFRKRGWNVIATMRSPEKGKDLATLNNVLVTRLDVTDAPSIDSAIKAGIDRFGSIDVLLNNAITKIQNRKDWPEVRYMADMREQFEIPDRVPRACAGQPATSSARRGT